MNAGRASIVIFQKMRIKNLTEVNEVRLKKIRIFLGNGRLRVNIFVGEVLILTLL